MAKYDKWKNVEYSIGEEVWWAQCPECQTLVESYYCIPENYKYCPYCGSKMIDEQTEKEMVYKYLHWCDDCPKAYDFTCSGANAKKCEEARNKLIGRENG